MLNSELSMSALSQAQRVRLLYKGILRLHRSLPAPMKEIGDSYVKEEFKRHKNATETHAILFMKEWTNYYVTLSNQMGRDAKKRPIGEQLDEQRLDSFTDEQLAQLYELYKELKDPGEQSAADK